VGDCFTCPGKHTLSTTFTTFDDRMSANNGVPVYTELDEQRFKIWFSRLEESYKVSLMTIFALHNEKCWS
jgi:hypothetical protein